MNLRTLVHEAADTLRNVPIVLANDVAVIVLERGDTRASVEAEIGRTARCLVVSADRFTPTVFGTGGIYGTTGIVVSVFERPAVNRAGLAQSPSDPGFETDPVALNLAQAAANALDGAGSADSAGALYLDEITPLVELDSASWPGVVTCDVVFTLRDFKI